MHVQEAVKAEQPWSHLVLLDMQRAATIRHRIRWCCCTPKICIYRSSSATPSCMWYLWTFFSLLYIWREKCQLILFHSHLVSFLTGDAICKKLRHESQLGMKPLATFSSSDLCLCYWTVSYCNLDMWVLCSIVLLIRLLAQGKLARKKKLEHVLQDC